jgi:hypothetical protein
MRASLLTAAALVAASASLAAQPPESAPSRPPDLKTVLARAAAHVEEFREKLSGIVAEETYVQQEIPGERRELRSDLLLVRSETFPHWLQFRDTFEVDGEAVRDREERLTHLFLEPATAVERAKRIASDSSRYNLGVVERTINVPLMPLVFLERDVQPRFRFSRAGDDERAAVPEAQAGHFRVSTEVWVIHFEERERPTIVRDSVNRRDVPSQGRFWIEPSSGRVLMSEMRSNHPGVRAEITVNYQSAPLLGLLVPIAMFERYSNILPARRLAPSQYWRRIEATATYDKFRRFQVHVEQDVDLPPGPIDNPLPSQPAPGERPNDERPNDERPDDK